MANLSAAGVVTVQFGPVMNAALGLLQIIYSIRVAERCGSSAIATEGFLKV